MSASVVSISAGASCPLSAVIGSNIRFDGSHGYKIDNQGNEPVNVSVTATISDSNGNSFSDSDSELIPPGSSKSGSVSTVLFASYSEAGQIIVTAATEISGDAQDSASGTCTFTVEPANITSLEEALKEQEVRLEAFSESYNITVYTPVIDNGGTDEAIYIHLKGVQGQFSAQLNNPGRDDFEQGSTSVFSIQGPLIAPIQEVGLRLERITDDGNWRWNCGWVEVTNSKTGFSVRVDGFGWVDNSSTIFWKKPS
jgi:PLAT/LH2 domain